MKLFRISIFSLLLAGAIFFTGCIEINTLITVNKDGSGTVEETVLLTREVINMISEFQKSFSDSTSETKPFEFYNPEELEGQASNFGGKVKYLSSHEVSTENKSGYVVTYGFSDINELKINQNPDSRVKLEAVSEEPEVVKEFVTFSFKKGEPAEVRIRMPEDKKLTGDVNAETDSALQTMEADSVNLTEQIAAIFKDLRMSMTLKVNGDITKTNAEYRDGSIITLLDVNFSELLGNAEKLKEFRKVNPQNFEQVKEILKGIPGIKVEFNNPVFVQFE